jgi:hypothetical protein
MEQKVTSFDSDKNQSTVSWTILRQLERMHDYVFNMFSAAKLEQAKFDTQAVGYALLVNQLESVMHPVLQGDEFYEQEIHEEGLEVIRFPVNNTPQAVYEYIMLCDKKVKIMSKRFFRFGLIPIVPTSLSLLTRTQKYSKFKDRIKAQAIKYVDLYGEDLVDYVRNKREGKTPKEIKEMAYSDTYLAFLKQAKVKYEEMEEDAVDYIEEH